MEKVITIKDIARLAGVGVGTVSRALNGGKNVDPETFSKILAIVKELNYKPNNIARKLAKGNYSQKTIGVVVPVIINPFYYEILKGVYDKVIKENYNLLLFNLGNHHKEETLKHIIEENLIGIIFIAENIPVYEKKLLNSGNVKYVYIDYHEENENSFFLDNKKGGTLVAQYFITNNIKRIAYIGEHFVSQQQIDRFNGFKEELEKNNFFIEVIKYINNDEKESYILTLDLLKENPQIEGIFYFCDNMAYGGLKARSELKSNVTIIGFDDMMPSKFLGLSTIAQ
ncbi:MAG: hypothetical protein A2086_00415, partial [Spirochaetes bacterium GWD1_27_9]